MAKWVTWNFFHSSPCEKIETEKLYDEINNLVFFFKNAKKDQWFIKRYIDCSISMELGSKATENEIQNFQNATFFILSAVDKKLSLDFILEIHSIVMNCTSRLRQTDTFARRLDIDGNETKTITVYCPFTKVEEKIKNLIQEFKHEKKSSIRNASEFMCKFLAIHPFTDGNGRCARLIFSWMLRDFLPVLVPLYTTAYTNPSPRHLTMSEKALFVCSLQHQAENPKTSRAFERYVLESIKAYLNDFLN